MIFVHEVGYVFTTLFLGPRLCLHHTCSWAHLHLVILLTTILNHKRTEVVMLDWLEGHKLFV